MDFATQVRIVSPLDQPTRREEGGRKREARQREPHSVFGPQNAFSLRGVAPGTFFVTTGLR